MPATKSTGRPIRVYPLLLVGSWILACEPIIAQAPPGESLAPQTATEDRPTSPLVPEKVEVEPTARDDEIRARLVEILRATTWFENPQVAVDDGVVFLDGTTDDEQFKTWAQDLARNTEGVVAVVNRIDIATPTALDFEPARQEFESLLRGFVRALPLLLIGLLIIFVTWFAAKAVGFAMRRVLRRRLRSNLLLNVTARACGVLVFLLGLYLVLRISGLSRLAVTVLGGTGLVGLVLGIAFRDITENFLASLILSLQQPFREGDLVEIAGTMGYVQRLNSRTTVLMTLDGNLVQIPNSTVFKSQIRNYTSNPNWRQEFTIGISYNDAIPTAQEVALGVLAQHPAVLNKPEPWVLVDSLGPSSVMLRVYFWLDVSQHSWLKVRSSVIRLVKRAFQDAGITLPDEAREVIFPEGVPVRMIDDGQARSERRAEPAPARESEAVSTAAEDDLQSESASIKEQAQRAWAPDEGENLLTGPAATPVKEGQT